MSSIADSKQQSPDVVFVGGGPVGLWTAIQTKLLTNKNILIIEKYLEYKRADIRLNIDSSSFAGVPDYEPLKALIQKWGGRVVPIKEMEEALTKCAHDFLGIKFLKAKRPIRSCCSRSILRPSYSLGPMGRKARCGESSSATPTSSK